ncbi:MAG: peptide deformylase [Phycisphaerales bacterium]|nr:peptide deformylase [Phycisphaerales bacterium]
MMVDPASLRIVLFPAEILRRKADPVAVVTDEVRAVARRMLELMRDAEGIGLAAPQVGLPWRLFVTGPHEGEPERVFINPELTEPSEELEVHEEGCLSIPNVRVEVRRPREITISALDLDGRPFTLRRSDLLARAWQHEVDHLNGVLIIDRMGPMDRLANRRAIRDLKSAAG